jgi:hypothetical protein
VRFSRAACTGFGQSGTRLQLTSRLTGAADSIADRPTNPIPPAHANPLTQITLTPMRSRVPHYERLQPKPNYLTIYYG